VILLWRSLALLGSRLVGFSAIITTGIALSIGGVSGIVPV